VAALVVAGVVLAWHFWHHSGSDRIKAMIDWPDSCIEVATTHVHRDWPHAADHTVISCEHAGPIVIYARFGSRAALQGDLLADPPDAPTCIAKLEVVVDYLDPGRCPPLCRKLHGDRIDGVTGMKPTESDMTLGGYERAADIDERRATDRERRALVRYFG
jgi:hypothetical protein